MLRTFRIDRPAQRKPSGRRLTLQRLEERLTLSTVSPTTTPTQSTSLNLDLSVEGGFVNVGTLGQGFILSPSDVVTRVTSFNDQSFTNSNALSGDLDISIIPPLDPFLYGPDGGMEGPFVENSPFGPLPPEEIFPEAESSLAEESSTLRGVPQRLTHEIVLSRGREVFFEVATLDPPQTIARPDRVALGARTVRLLPAQSESSSLENPSAPAARGEQSHDPSATKSPSEVTTAEQPAAAEVGAVSRPQETNRAIGTAHDRDSTNQTVPASPSEARQPLAAISPANLHSAAVSAEEARSQVFADWRNRDLVALPLLVALAVGPRLVRSLRGQASETQQTPPKKNRQAVAP